MSIDHEMESLRLAAESSSSLETVEVLHLKREEWKRQLVAEGDLGRQQQLVNLIKSVEPILAARVEREEMERRPIRQDDVERALEALRARNAPSI